MPGKFQEQSNLYSFPNNFGGYFTGFQNLGPTTLGQWPGATYEQESLEVSPSAPRLVPTLSTHRLLNELRDTHKLSALWKRISVLEHCCCLLFSRFGTSGLQHTRLAWPSPSPRVCSNSCPLSQQCHPASCPLPSPSPAFNLSQYQGLFQWVSSSYQVAKVLELQLQHQSFQWIVSICFL